MTSGGDGVFGNLDGHAGELENTDWYAPGDSRIPNHLGVISRKGKVKTKKNKKKKRKA